MNLEPTKESSFNEGASQCPMCHGRKNIESIGMMLKKCDTCLGLGYLVAVKDETLDKKVTEPSVIAPQPNSILIDPDIAATNAALDPTIEGAIIDAINRRGRPKGAKNKPSSDGVTEQSGDNITA